MPQLPTSTTLENKIKKKFKKNSYPLVASVSVS